MHEWRECRYPEKTWVEIDYRKYPKVQLSKFKKAAVERMLKPCTNHAKDGRKRKEEHIFILYRYPELNDVLRMLKDVYDVPMLGGIKILAKEETGETCDGKILSKFHDCFSGDLTKLT